MNIPGRYIPMGILQERDRASSLTEIAKVLGVSTSSLSETLRRAMKKTVRDYLTRKNP